MKLFIIEFEIKRGSDIWIAGTGNGTIHFNLESAQKAFGRISHNSTRACRITLFARERTVWPPDKARDFDSISAPGGAV